MLLALALTASVGTAFVHPNPTPPADLPVSIYQERRARLLAELGGCVAVISAQGEVSGVTEDFRQDADFY
jgi:hypothetical protein